jgi:hypothetical protein
MAKFCQGDQRSRSEAPNRKPYQAGLHKLCVDIVVLGRGLDLKNDLDQRAGEVLDEDELSQ